MSGSRRSVRVAPRKGSPEPFYGPRGTPEWRRPALTYSSSTKISNAIGGWKTTWLW